MRFCQYSYLDDDKQKSIDMLRMVCYYQHQLQQRNVTPRLTVTIEHGRALFDYVLAFATRLK